jgi:phosphoribosyl 1,2-cyclic phosphodiesterase
MAPMSLRVCVLGSGSSGNCTYIGCGSSAVLIDAGLSALQTSTRLETISAPLSGVHGICVSHEHSDHTAGLRVLNRRHGIRVYANFGTVEALRRDEELTALEWQIFSTGTAFPVGEFRIEPFTVPHDALEPVGFVVQANGTRVGVVTDMGMSTTLIREKLRSCHVIVVEANHDEDMLKKSKRPWPLIQRILGRQGHLCNDAAAEMLGEIAGPELRHVFLAHISTQCNRRELALKTADRMLRGKGHSHIKVSLTYPDRVSDIWEG